MAEKKYGLTATGPHIKRLDEILNEMHDDLTEAWGLNTRQDPQSLLNHLLTNIADQLTDLWAFGEDVYYSQYPTSAEGASLDYSTQYGGVLRESPAKSYYRILCTGREGTVLPAGTLIHSDTNPKTKFTIDSNALITRASFNKAELVVAETNTATTMSVSLNGTLYLQDHDSSEDDIWHLKQLKNKINVEGSGFTASVDEDDGILTIEAVDEVSDNIMELSDNLSTKTVSSLVLFGSVEDGDISIPDGVITRIEKSVAGLERIVNVGSYIAGRKEETDTELRQSYIDKIYNRSSSMAESIRSAILEQVQGVDTCSVFENYTNYFDAKGRSPHSVEVVVDGSFDPSKLAQVILNTKAGGINTFGSNTVTLPGVYGEPIEIRYNTPIPVYVWFRVVVYKNSSGNLPTNYTEVIEEVIIDWMAKHKAGDDVAPQMIVKDLFAAVPGVDYFDIYMYSTEGSGTSPASTASYTDRRITIDDRQKAVTDADWIAVEEYGGSQ